MDEVTARKRRFISTIVIGGGVFASLSIALANTGFPGTSKAGHFFAWALIGSVVLALVSFGARKFAKVPTKARVTKPLGFRTVFRLCSMAAQLMLLILTVVSLPFGHGAAELLFRGFIVSLLLSVLLFLTSDAVLNFALLSKRFRASVMPAD